MNNPTVSLMLTRRYLTELVRTPRAAAALGGRKAHPKPRLAVPSSPAKG